jgi:26S proteasome regulatory subunit N3
MTTHETTFRADDTYTLISRLRQNVIKTGLRTMSLTYSRISLRDVCLKLGLDSEETTEYIVAKAIRDGVIEATINHEGGYMQNKEVLDVYATEEPMLAFDERIRFCMSLHNEAIKVLPPPPNPTSYSHWESYVGEEVYVLHFIALYRFLSSFEFVWGSCLH